jgi:hypothetical protein
MFAYIISKGQCFRQFFILLDYRYQQITLCYGEKPNAIARYKAESLLHICKKKFKASNTYLNSTENIITRKEYYSFLAKKILHGHKHSDVPSGYLTTKVAVHSPTERVVPSPYLHSPLLSLWSYMGIKGFSFPYIQNLALSLTRKYNPPPNNLSFARVKRGLVYYIE